MRIELSDGVSLFVHEVGEGFPVVVLHGGPGLDHTHMSPWLDSLGDEFRLLYALALEQGRVVTRDELLQKIWGRRQTRRDRTVDVFVRKLRDKIDRQAPTHAFVHTRYGVGYKLAS